ncbi:MAG: sodium/solute symporter [Pirellulales bacterium]|nr:sodium/solute symporter [Pirellulales bacterium]
MFLSIVRAKRNPWIGFCCGMALFATPRVAWAQENPAPIQHIGIAPLDWIVLALYGVGMLGIGWFYSRRTRNTEDYLLGGRTMRSGSVGLSLFATLLSTITYLALPGEMIKYGPVILWCMVAIPIAYLVVGYLLIPHFMKLRVTSAYEILEIRLGIRIRLLGSVIFLMTRMLWMALIIYLTADKIIVVMMGWPAWMTPYVSIIIGVVTVIYTSMGGLRAVVFTDVLQTFILFVGALLALLLITIKMGGFGWWPSEWSPSWGYQPVFSLDPHIRVTVVGSIVYMTVWWICTAGSDQMAIQRYLATRDTKAARRVFLITGLANILVYAILAILGFALMGFFRANPDLLHAGMSLGSEKTADIIFPYFIIRFLPPGITGLVLAGLLAAAMSSLSSGINSSTSVIATDFVDRFRTRADTDADRVRKVKIIAIAIGLVAVLLSAAVGRLSGNIMEVSVRTNHIFVAPLFGLFLMALFVRRATPLATACGALASCVVAVIIAYWDIFTGDPSAKLSFQWISLISLIVMLAVAIPLSRIWKPPDRYSLP